MSPPILTLSDIHLSFGGQPLLSGVNMTISPGERLCIVGRNGSGKSTLLKIAAEHVEPDQGERFVQPGVTRHYLLQEPDLSAYETTYDYIVSGLSPSDETYRAQYLAEQLGLSGTEHPQHISGGETRRAALAQALAASPDILFLDEPTNHLDLQAIEWLEKELAKLSSALVLISHDRRFLETLSQTTLWLDRGKARRLSKGFSHFESWRDKTLELEAQDQHKLSRKIAMEEDWLRYGVTARRKRNQKRLADLFALRSQKQDYQGPVATIKLSQIVQENAGKRVIEVKNISKSFGSQTLIKDLSLKIHKGEKIGIIGPNGSGKTTLLNILTNRLTPDTGSLRLGTKLDIVTLEQKRDSLNPDWTLKEALTSGSGDIIPLGTQSKHVMSYMKDFLFKPEQANTPISVLSGGERARIMLARSLAKPSNLLILDEPTNDLDLETLDLLQEMLSDYSETVLLVSHDRDFIDRTVTSILVYEGNGKWQQYPGGYSDMLKQRNIERMQPPSSVTKTKTQKNKLRTTSPQKTKRKLSYKEGYMLETLPQKISDLERRIQNLHIKLANPELFTKDPEAFYKFTEDLQSSETTLAEHEDQWLELEMLRESLEQPTLKSVLVEI
ncbi:MAG: ABC-F family ATP-binding cassette domain-containing protein [Pseudomonadota bacterium]